MLQSPFSKVPGFQACNVVKKGTPRQVFFREYCEIFKNIYFEKHLETVASETQLVNTKLFVKIRLCKNMLSKTYYKTRNAGTQNNGTRNTCGTAEHPQTVVEQRSIPEYQQNTNVTSAEQHGTLKPYKEKNNCIVF